MVLSVKNNATARACSRRLVCIRNRAFTMTFTMAQERFQIFCR